MSNVPDVTDQNFQSEVLESDVPVLVDFHAVWCGPCKSLAPIIDEMATEFAGRAKMVKCDIDQATEVAARHQIMAVPTLLFFKNGEVAQKLTGARKKPELVKALEGVL